MGMKYQTPAMPWEEDKSLANLLRQLKGKGILAFSARHLNNPELIELQHEQHVKTIIKRANKHERQETTQATKPKGS